MVPGQPTKELVLFFWLVFFSAGRVAIYCDGCLPPLSLMGRLVHLRPIIPGYDKVFAAPLLALAVGVASWYAATWTGAELIVVLAAAIMLNWWILLGMGPSLKAWRLTGNHRITRGLFQKEMVRAG